MDFSLAITYATTFIIFLYFIYMLLGIFSNKKGRTPPKVAGAWPVIGHLHLIFGGSNPPQKTLGLMADKYGPIFTVKFGSHQVVVVNDTKIAQECFTTNDKALAGRPKSLAAEIMGYNYAIFAMSSYGPYWREMKKIVVLELLSNRQVQMHRHIREFQMKTSLKQIYEMMNSSPNIVKIEMKEWLGNLNMTIIVRMLFGNEHDLEHVQRSRKAIETFLKFFRTFVVADFIPSLRWLDIGGYEKEMKENAKETDYILEKWLVEHKKKRSCGEKKCEDEKDFMDIMLSLFEGAMDEDLAGFDADTIIKSTCLAMLAAGSASIGVVLTWTLSLLLNNPHVMEKAQEELDIQVGRNTPVVDESQINNLVYLQAIIKESFRLYPPGPLSFPHEAMEDCTVGGYIIPKGTRVQFNLWKIQQDTTVWSDIDLFKPERFLTTHKDIDVKGNHFELIPFSAGRRMCPGISSTLVLLHLTLANLLHAFEITRPSGKPIDMTMNFGTKATPLEVILAPRLSPDLYL